MSTTRGSAQRGRSARRYDPAEDVDGLELLVRPAAAAARSAAVANRRGGWSTQLRESRARLAAAVGEPELLALLADEASALIDARCTVSVLAPDGTLRRCVGPGSAGPPPGDQVPTEGTACGEAVRTRTPVLLPDTLAPGPPVTGSAPGTAAGDSPAVSGRCCPGARSVLAVPLRARGGRVLGVLAVLSDHPGWFADVDSQTAVDLADAAAQRLGALRAQQVVPTRTSASAPASTSVSTPVSGPVPTAAPVRIPEARSAPAAPDRTPSLGLGLWEWDRDTDRVTLSPQVKELARLAGASRPDLDALRLLLHPDDRERFEQAWRRLVDTGTGWNGTARLVLPDGEIRQVYAWADARRSGGAVVGAWGAVVDVTQREQDAAALRTSLVGLRAAQELTGLGTWEWHPQDDTLVWSAEMFRLVGLEPGELRPTLATWHDFVHPEDVDRARRLDLETAHGVGNGGVETFRVIGADGVLRHVQSWSGVVTGAGGPERIVCGATVDVTRQVRDRVMLERLSATDAVTGLGNRHAFDARMTELLAQAGGDVALLLLDLDRFKLVNDSLGHQVGDRLLVEVARRLSAVVPPGSTTARMGGDEFVVVPEPGLDWLQVRRLAQAIVDALRMPYVLPDSGEMLVCPASVGVTASAGRAVGADELLSEADLALYRAKDSGRDRYVVFDDHLRKLARTRHRAERLLRRALDRGGLMLQYQPIVDFADGRVVGAEALVRIRDGNRDEPIPPDAFIEVAEDTGLVVELDCWVIDEALAQSAAWTAQVGPWETPWLAINVSARSMEHPRVVRRLLDGARRAGIRPDRLKVELTEHSFLGALPGGEGSLRQLLGSGIPVGIDDFGTGYSALAYLQRFDLDFMKIDRSFVADVGQDDRADAVVTAIIDLAHAHGMRVTAEGIETPRQARRLREMGCDLAQGYHFGRPGDADAIVRG